MLCMRLSLKSSQSSGSFVCCRGRLSWHRRCDCAARPHPPATNTSLPGQPGRTHPTIAPAVGFDIGPLDVVDELRHRNASWPWACHARAIVGAVVFVAIATGCSNGAGTSSNATTVRTAPAQDNGGQSSSDTGTESGLDSSACQLLSDAEVTTAMKQPMKSVGGAGSLICEYAAVADPSTLLAVQTFSTLADATLYTQLESSSEHVAGLGDDAFWNSTLDMVFVKKGDRGFSVTSPSLANLTGDPNASKDALVILATTVLAKF